MAGKIKQLIDNFIEKRSNGNRIIALTTKARLILKGINVDDYDENSPDDPDVIAELMLIRRKFND